MFCGQLFQPLRQSAPGPLPSETTIGTATRTAILGVLQGFFGECVALASSWLISRLSLYPRRSYPWLILRGSSHVWRMLHKTRSAVFVLSSAITAAFSDIECQRSLRTTQPASQLPLRGSNLASLWDVHGDNLDLSYVNIREGSYAQERALQEALNIMWASYEPYADPDFREGFARDLDARFWEMYLGKRLIDAGKTLLPTAERQRTGGQPDICVIDGSRRIWIEAIAPEVGDPGPDQVEGPVPINEGGGIILAPTRQAQLRATSAFRKKFKAVESYIREGVIGPDDVRLIAIGAGRFGAYVSEYPLPLIMSAVFPIGKEFASIDIESGQVVEQGFQHSPEIARQGGAIPRNAFLTEQFSPISGIIWSRAGIGNFSRPLTLVHNPLATLPMPQHWGVWDREFVASNDGDQWIATDIRAGINASS